MWNSKKRTIGAVLTGAAVLFWGASQLKADLSPATCTPGSNSSDAVPQASSPGPFAVGERMGYRVLLTNPTLDKFLNPGCTISNAHVELRMPNGDILPILTNIVLLPGQQIICPGDPECLSTSRTGLIGAQLFYTNTVTAGHVAFINPTVPQCPPAAGTNAAILAFTLGGAIVFNNPGSGVFGTATYNRCSTIPVNQPCIACFKDCSNATGTNFITFTGFVTNCGNSQLVNVTASNLVGGVLVPITLASNTLNPGAFVPFSGSYANPNICAPVTDTILVRGTDPLLTTNATVTSQCSDTCSNIVTRCIGVTKSCPAPAAAGRTNILVTGTVTNCGNITLTNVFVVDDNGTRDNSGDDIIVNLGSIGPNGSANYIITNRVSPTFCGPITNTLIAFGIACGIGVTATNSCATTNLCLPQICVIKEVACAPVGNCTPGLAYGEGAIGVAGPTNQTAFCYKIVVRNCGQDVLTNVVVSDPDIGSPVLPGFPSTLAIGESATNFVKFSWGLGSHTNRVTASGTGASSGVRVSTNDIAITIVLPISIACDLVLSSAFDMDGNTNDNHLTLPDSGPVGFWVLVSNSNPYRVQVNLSGLPGLPCVSNGVATAQLNPASTFTICCRVPVTCPRGTNFNVTVQATALASTNFPCVLDANGNAVTSAPSQCEATVNCETPVTCRVTGGGELNFDVVDHSCVDVETTLFPTTTPGGLELDHISHGGQLGAPFSQMDCGAILGNPCIRGEWQHTRHYKGKGNPRDVIDMSVHSANPKGVYDSLSCACLGCCIPADGTNTFQAGFVGPLHNNQKFALCNPDDHKICGPQPRPSPANAIIFSGIATIKREDDSGPGNRAAEYVIFRVYIEDRSEPGGNFPKGAVEPSDIYCFQAWKTGISVTKKPDFSTVSTAFRTALGQANCDFLNDLQTGALPIGSLPSPAVDGVTADIQDCGPLDRGNHQIHPSTSATCDQ